MADLYLINTCTVTAASDQQSRQTIRQAIRRNPAATIVVTGCYVQVDPSAIARIEGVDLILGNREKSDLGIYLEALSSAQRKSSPPEIAVGEISKSTLFQDLPLPEGTTRTRPLLKIQEGCNGNCSYCIVPHARGPERSLPTQQVKNRLMALLSRGFREIVLTGIRLGAYGRDLDPGIDLSGLLRELSSLPGEWRMRLSSLEPQDISPSLVSVLKDEARVCRHLHLPLQSGDDEILSLMGRGASVNSYQSLLRDLQQGLPDLGLGADIIVGFPGEREEHFMRTFCFLEEMPFSYLHVFPFSPRPGTRAATLPHPPSPQEKSERTRRLRSLAKEKSRAFRWQWVGKTLEGIVLQKRDARTGLWHALSHNYVPILIQDANQELAAGHLITITIEGMDRESLTLLGRRKK